jgi:hypothetical protein
MMRGVRKLGFKFTLTMAGYNLIRLPKLIEVCDRPEPTQLPASW